MNRFLMVCAFALFWAGGVVSADLPIKLPAHPHSAFGPGEKFTYDLKYEFVSAGTATMEVQRGPLVQGYNTINIVSKAVSSDFVDVFFKVRDYNASLVEENSLATVHFHQNLKEGKYHVMRNTAIDYQRGQYSYEKVYKGKTKVSTGPITVPVSDILSSFYKVRAMKLELGKDYELTVFSDGDVYQLKLKVAPKVEKIKVPAGDFECIRIAPTILGDGIFKAKEGKMTIWLTNDNLRMPVMIRSRVAVGSFDAELIEHKLADAVSQK